MAYDILIRDLSSKASQKAIGTDKGLAKIGDSIVNFAYSVAKSIFLTKNSVNKKTIRTGKKVNKIILADALRKANLKIYAKTRADAHDLADTVEALIAYVWLTGKVNLESMINIISENLSGDFQSRTDETKNATTAFTKLLDYIKNYLPKSKI